MKNEASTSPSSLRNTPGPHPVDVHVGKRLSLARKMKRLSQTTLGDALGVTFQQVQKYERGTNRVSASTMFAIMRFLNVPASYFFEGLDWEYIGETDPGTQSISPEVLAFLSSALGLQIVEQLAVAPRRVQNAFAILLENSISEPK